MSDETKARYEYDAEEGFFVDNGDRDEDGLGAELVIEEVVALLNAGEAAKAQPMDALAIARATTRDITQTPPQERTYKMAGEDGT